MERRCIGGGAILQAGELESLAKAVIYSIGDNGSDFCSGSDQNAEESEDTIGCAEEDMELDVPGKNIIMASLLYKHKVKCESLPGKMAVYFIVPYSVPENMALVCFEKS